MDTASYEGKILKNKRKAKNGFKEEIAKGPKSEAKGRFPEKDPKGPR
jgi:hypothetical protein